MLWLSSKLLRRLQKVARAISEAATFFAGITTTAILHLVFEHGTDFLKTSAGDPLTIFLVVLFALTITIRYVSKRWIEPRARHADLITAALRYLYHDLFGDTSGYTVTFLSKVWPQSQYIRPRYRYSYGRGTELNSKARFPRGAALAGMAWDLPGQILVKEIPDFTNDPGGFVQFSKENLKLSEEDLSLLSPHTQQARWLLSYGIAHPFSGEFIGVLSLDSRYDLAATNSSSEQDKQDPVDLDKVVTVAAIIAYVVGASSIGE